MHGREHGTLEQLGLIRANGPHQTSTLYHPPSTIDGKPVIQAAQLAGMSFSLFSTNFTNFQTFKLYTMHRKRTDPTVAVSTGTSYRQRMPKFHLLDGRQLGV